MCVLVCLRVVYANAGLYHSSCVEDKKRRICVLGLWLMLWDMSRPNVIVCTLQRNTLHWVSNHCLHGCCIHLHAVYVLIVISVSYCMGVWSDLYSQYTRRCGAVRNSNVVVWNLRWFHKPIYGLWNICGTLSFVKGYWIINIIACCISISMSWDYFVIGVDLSFQV